MVERTTTGSTHHRAVAVVLTVIFAVVGTKLLRSGRPADRTAFPRSNGGVRSPAPGVLDGGSPFPLDPNTADLASLIELPGVGPALARRIVAARDAGLLRSLDDLDRIPGIGPRLLERIAPLVRFPAEDAAGGTLRDRVSNERRATR